jgi:hypothetical protein
MLVLSALPVAAQNPSPTLSPEDCDPTFAAPSLLDSGAPAAAFGVPVDLFAKATPDPSCLEGPAAIALLTGEVALNTDWGVLVVTHPYTWVMPEDQDADSGLLVFANDESVLEKPLEGSYVPPFEPGEALIATGVLPLEAFSVPERPASAPLTKPGTTDAAPPDLRALVESFSQQFVVDNGMVMVGAPTPAVFNDRAGIYAFFAGNFADVLVVLVTLETDGEPVYALLIGISAPDESLDVELSLFEMARSLTFTTPESSVSQRR